MPPANETTTIVQRELICDLTERDLLERGDTMAECELQVQRLRTERSRLNAALREQTDRRSELATVIDSKKETRDVSCEWVPDYKKKRWGLMRLDTKAIIEEREMTPADLQTKLPGTGVKDKTPAEPKRKGRKSSKSN
jgi:predicted RNase H-like nuclease (RuvC/YqgF family)